MKTKLFLEPRGKVREEIILHSAIPDTWVLFKKWKQVWISKKEFKKWIKQNWESEKLGNIRPGKILSIESIDSESDRIKGSLYAFRSYYLESTGEKKKLPMLLVGQLKKNFNVDRWVSDFTISDEQKEELKTDLKHDPWGPISVWHAAPLKRNDEIPITELITDALGYSKALFSSDFNSVPAKEFVETEIFKG